jgi:hypothetical protein
VKPEADPKPNRPGRRRWLWAMGRIRMSRVFGSSSGGVEILLTEPGPLGVTLRADAMDGPPRIQVIEPGGPPRFHKLAGGLPGQPSMHQQMQSLPG